MTKMDFWPSLENKVKLNRITPLGAKNHEIDSLIRFLKKLIPKGVQNDFSNSNMNEKEALVLGCLWRTPLPSETLQAWAQLAEPSGNTHIMQVGERSRLPRGRLLGTERIPKERHL